MQPQRVLHHHYNLTVGERERGGACSRYIMHTVKNCPEITPLYFRRAAIPAEDTLAPYPAATFLY